MLAHSNYNELIYKTANKTGIKINTLKFENFIEK